MLWKRHKRKKLCYRKSQQHSCDTSFIKWRKFSQSLFQNCYQLSAQSEPHIGWGLLNAVVYLWVIFVLKELSTLALQHDFEKIFLPDQPRRQHTTSQTDFWRRVQHSPWSKSLKARRRLSHQEGFLCSVGSQMQQMSWKYWFVKRWILMFRKFQFFHLTRQSILGSVCPAKIGQGPKR